MARQNWYYYLALLCIACAGIPKGAYVIITSSKQNRITFV